MNIAVITLDDGKRNAFNRQMVQALDDALDRAENDNAVVVLTGRPDTLSAGFDLKVMQRNPVETIHMLNAGYALLQRLVVFPLPIVLGVNGHAIAFGSFLPHVTDYRIGTAGDFKIGANEVLIGMSVPRAALAAGRHRLARQWFHRAMLLGQIFNPEEAVVAGYLDEITTADNLLRRCVDVAASFAPINLAAYAENKRRANHTLLQEMIVGSDQDIAALTREEP